FPLSHPIYIFFYYTHPPVLERLRELGIEVNTNAKEALEGTCPTID
ncbi:MAG: M48 family peptidase, partial [Thiovulaceae bacterium]|nr:M48 family peptidase [Sulfurimonadaceae bacterium]